MAIDDMDRKRYPAPGRCIYCGDAAAPHTLTREHIIPLALGSHGFLPGASCEQCRETTNKFEAPCIATMFTPLRYIFDLPSRRKSKWPKSLPLDIELDGKVETQQVPIEDLPSIPIPFPVFKMPGILRGLDPSDKWPGSREVILAFPNVPEREQRLKRIKGAAEKAKIHVSSSMQVELFARMLAKIAHSYAVAECGLDSFRPFLPPLILGKEQGLSHLIGGAPEGKTFNLLPSLPGKTHHLHFVQIDGMHNVGALRLFGVLVHLFKDIGAPVYLVVVGEPTLDLVRRLSEPDPPRDA
jgi:hypothetical protein